MVLLFGAMAADLEMHQNLRTVLEGLCPTPGDRTDTLEISGPTELKLMRLLWGGDGWTRAEITAASADWRSEPLSYSTVNVTLKELQQKGLVCCEKARRGRQRCNVYWPLPTKAEYLERVFLGALKDLQVSPIELRHVRATLAEHSQNTHSSSGSLKTRAGFPLRVG